MSNLMNWLQALSVADRRQIARRAGTSEAYLRQVSSGHRKPSADLELKLRAERARMKEVEFCFCPTCGLGSTPDEVDALFRGTPGE
mgnify:CR=1 FL=1